MTVPSQKPISRFSVPALPGMPSDIRERLLAVQEKSGGGDDDFATLAEHGFDQEDAWDIAAIAAFFGLSNRMANVGDMRPNDEFFELGR